MKKSQKVRVFEYMVREGSISQMDAFSKLHIVNLPGRIYDLRQEGAKINKFKVLHTNEEGVRADYEKYYVAADNTYFPSDEKKQPSHSEAERTDIPRSEQTLQKV